ncbi:hypothetical protein DY000_02062406, partial [Brassica cretica]
FCNETADVIAVSATVFTLQNSCPYTVWPGILSGNSNTLGDGGFPLTSGASVQLTAPPRRSQMHRRRSSTDHSRRVHRRIRRLRQGFLRRESRRRLQRRDIMDPRTGIVAACKSACAAFNAPEFCCTGAHATPQTCSPTHFSAVFKNACPSAYSYAYDDATSTFTCSGANYLITFCPTRS